MPLLEIRNLTVRFPTRHGAFTAVDGVDIAVDRDELLAIVGESGSGKSVAMLAVMGLLPPHGAVSAPIVMRFDGRDLLTMSRRGAARASPGKRHGDDLSGADVVAQPVLHRRLPDRRGAEDASEADARRAAAAQSSSCCARSAFPIPSGACTPFRTSSPAA